MFGVSFLEIALVGLVSLLVVGPQKLPAMMRTAGEWVGKIRRMTADMRAQTGIDDILREEGIDGVRELRTLLKGERAMAARRSTAPSQLGYDAYSADPDPAVEFPVEGPDANGALPDDLIDESESPAETTAVETGDEKAAAENEAAEDAPAEPDPTNIAPVQARHAEVEAVAAKPAQDATAAPLTTAVPDEAHTEAASPRAASLPETAPTVSVRPPAPSKSRPPAPPKSRPPAPSKSRPPTTMSSGSGSRPPPPSAPRSEPPRPPSRSAPPIVVEKPPVIFDKPESIPPPPATPRLSPPRAVTQRETPKSKAPVEPRVTSSKPPTTSEPPPDHSSPHPSKEGDPS